MKRIERICIIRFSSMGDIILTTPVFRLLRRHFPNAGVDLVTKAQYAGLLAADPYLRSVIPFDHHACGALQALAKQLNEREYDLCLDLHGNLRSRYLRSVVRCGQWLRYPKRRFCRWLLVYTGWNLFRSTPSARATYIQTLASLGITDDGAGPALTLSPRHYAEKNCILEKFHLPPNAQYVILAPGAGTETKSWKVSGFVQCGTMVRQQTNVAIVVAGGIRDTARCRAVAESTGRGAVSLAGELSWGGTAALIAESLGVVCNDSWMLHAAEALHRPAIVMFGPTTREMGYFPESVTSRVVEAQAACRPCSHTGSPACPLGHFRCMNDIDGRMVGDLVLEHFFHDATTQ